MISNGGIIKTGTGTLELTAANIYIGNTQVNAGTLLLAENAELSFLITGSSTSNKITGTGAGTVKLDGIFVFDLTGAAAVGSWNIVDVDNLTETFGATFSITNFTETSSGVWEYDVNNDYVFTESTGLLATVPEPETWGLLAFGLMVVLFLRRRRMLS